MKDLVKIRSNSLKERKILMLYSSVNVLDNGCWEWKKAKDKNGYGITSYGIPRKNYRAHRLIYLLMKGDIPDGMIVCHHCDFPSCVNINHLFLGKPKDNSRDRENKGRGRTQNQYGENNHSAKLNSRIVLEIRELHDQGKKECELIKIYGLRQATISKILLRKRWKHI